jgi:hypothetical protein
MYDACRLRDVEKVVHLQGRGFGGELTELGMGDAFQEWIGIERVVQPVEPIDPQLDRFRCCGAGRLLEAIEAGCRAVGRLGQQLLVAGFRLCRSGENVNDKVRALSRLVGVMIA